MKLFTKLYLTLLCLLTAGVMTVNAQEDEIFDFDASFYHSWSEVSATATDNGTAGGGVKLNEEVGEGGTIWGNLGGSVPYLCYANITDYSELRFEGTPGATIRIMCNRLVDEGPIYEIRPTIGQDGKLTVSISDLKYLNGGTACNFVCLQSIKIPWGGSAATITSIKIVKPGDPLSVPKDDLKKAINAGKLVSPVAKTAESFAVLTRAISSAETALVAENATAESLQAAAKAVNDAIDGLALAEGYYNLTKEMYKHWNDNYNPTESSEFNGAYVVGESTGQPYGDGSVYYLNFADISAYDKLILTVADGTPRIMMNRLEVGNGGGDNNGGSYVQLTDAPVNGVVEVDLTAYEYAHLNAIKGANYANVTVTGMYLYKSPAPVLNTYTATFTTNRGWEKVYAYAWTGETKFLGDWPGTELTATDGVYNVSIKADAAPANIIFNNGQGGEGNQTADLVFENGKAYDFNVAVEDVLPIDIQFGEKYNSQKVQNYTTTWTATKDGKTWTLVNFNNNNNGWTSVKCGSKSEASVASITSPAINAEVKGVTISVTAAAFVNSAKLTIKNGEEKVGEDIDITEKFVAGEVVVPVEGQKGYSYVLTIDNAQATNKKNGSVEISKITLAAEVQEPVHIANTAETAYTVAQAIELIEAGEALSETVYVKGIVSRVDDDAFNSTYNSITYWISADGTTDGQQFECYSGKGIEGADFASKDDVAVGASVIVKGTLKKYGEIYEFNAGNSLVSYEAPVVLNTYTATFTTNQNWEKVYAYVWSGEGENKLLGDWPGTELTANEGVYTVTIQAAEAPAKIIFNSGAGVQTEDLAFENGKAYEFNKEDSELMAQAKTLAADADAVAVGKLTAAIAAAQSSGDESNLQAAINQFNADNADMEKDETAKVATNGWKKFDGSAAGVCATQFAPAIDTYDGRKDVKLAESYQDGNNGDVQTTGTIIYQDITGLANGSYKVGFYGNAFFTSGRGFDSTMEDGANDVAYVFANDQKEFITARVATSTTENNYRQFNVEVTDGTIKLGMGKEKPGTNWHTMQIHQLTWFTTAKAAYAAVKAEMETEIAAAKALKTESRTAGVDDFNAAIEAAEATLTSNMLNVTEFENEVANLKAAAAAFKKANWYIDFAAGEYYIIDTEGGKMMAAGHDYGTRGIVNEMGLDLTITPYTESRTVTIDSRVANGNNHFLGENLYMDSSEWGWALEYQGFGFYILEPKSGKYINLDEKDNLVLSDTPREFIIVTKEGVMAQRMEELAAATAENPVDATFLIKANNFNRNDARNAEAWTVSEDCTNKNLSGGADANRCAESYHSTFTISQAISGAPAGKYTLTAQGFFRQDKNANDVDSVETTPVFFIGDKTAEVPAKTGTEDNMGQASESFTAGKYTIEPIEFVYNGEGDLVVGIKNETAKYQWIIFDNFQLTYYGAIPAPATHTWDFTQWSEATVTNLKADAAASKTEGWSDVEKKADAEAGADPTEASKDNCFWSVAAPDANGELSANGVVIEELKGLAFNATYSTARSLAIAVNYPYALSEYQGPAYLWLGGGGKNVNCFVIKNVKVGTAIKMGVESHNTSDARGVQLFIEGAEGARGDMLKDAEGNEVAVPKTYTEQEWAVPATAGEGVCNVIVYNTKGCHIYYIDAEIGESEPVFATIETVEMRGATDENWQNTVNVTMTKSEEAANVYTGTLDLSKATTDYEFKLVVNNDNWLGFNQLTLDAPEGLVVAKDGDNNNFVLKHATSVYATYNIVATWVPNVSATANWTLKINNGIATGINTLKTAIENGAVYNLNGQKVMKAQKGLYIINGKKVVKK